jgi:hypothetical protein
MSRITQKSAVAPLEVLKTSTDASLATAIGERFDLSDGREVTLFQAGSVDLASGVLVQSAPIVANHQNLAVVSFTAASVSTGTPATIVATLGGTAATANQYAGGFVVVNDNAGEGQTLKVAANLAQASTSGNVTIYLEDSPVTALTSASEICLIPAVGSGVVINPTTPTNRPLGVTLNPVAASAYGLAVSKGATSALADASTAAVGLGIAPSTTTAGSVTVQAATLANIGSALQATVSTEYRTVFIDL